MLPPKTEHMKAFSLIELLIVVAVIGIISALVVTSITNATEDSRLVVARQQQVVLQEALNSWITAQTSVGQAQETYTANSDKLGLIDDYLRNENTMGTQANSLFYLDGTDVRSEVLQKAGKCLRFSGWTTNTYPYIIMTNK